MMKLWVGGKPLKRSARTTSRAGASKQLEQWKAQIRQGTYVPDADQTRFDELAALLIDEYRANGRKSLGRAEAAVDHLKGFFAGWRAQAISTDRVLAYVRHRQQQQAANATINRELAALKRMSRLGERAGRIVRRPFIDLLQEHNARTGFFERKECDAVLAQLPDDLQPVFAVASLTGWRVKSELLTRQWAHVDFQSGWLRLEPGETKNAEGRQFPPPRPPCGPCWSASARAPWRLRRRPARLFRGCSTGRAGRSSPSVAPGCPSARPPGCRAAFHTTSAGRPSGTSSVRVCPGRRP
jgi:integrase